MLRAIYPFVGKCIHNALVSCRYVVIINPLKIGHSHLTHSYLLSGEDQPTCTTLQTNRCWSSGGPLSAMLSALQRLPLAGRHGFAHRFSIGPMSACRQWADSGPTAVLCVSTTVCPSPAPARGACPTHKLPPTSPGGCMGTSAIYYLQHTLHTRARASYHIMN